MSRSIFIKIHPNTQEKFEIHVTEQSLEQFPPIEIVDKIQFFENLVHVCETGTFGSFYCFGIFFFFEPSIILVIQCPLSWLCCIVEMRSPPTCVVKTGVHYLMLCCVAETQGIYHLGVVVLWRYKTSADLAFGLYILHEDISLALCVCQLFQCGLRYASMSTR